MSETIEYIKNFNIGDRVTSTNSFWLDKGFKGVSGVIKKVVKDEVGSWQYLIDLEDGRTLQCDDSHLEQPKLDAYKQIELIELINVLDPKTDVTFEIVEETCPSGFYAKGVLEKYPHAIHYQVTKLDAGYYTNEAGKIMPTLVIVVSNGKREGRSNEINELIEEGKKSSE
ncbi:hypothetical protein GIX45_16030 [Erwinia sp. CPCC 100877]|nr:hypothetical protein [Erwinia sp. CPCC 100877]